MLNANRPSRRPSHKKSLASSQKGRTSRQERYQSDAQAYAMHRVGVRHAAVRRPVLLKVFPARKQRAKAWAEEARRPKHRRSQARLGRPEQTRPDLKATFLVPARFVLHLNWNMALNIGFLVLVGWILVWFFADDRFYVHNVIVSGNARVPSEVILAASSLQGYSIFWLDPRQVTAQIKQALPPIKQASVRCRLPNSVTLDVEEEGRQVMWQVAGVRYWVDDDGRLQPAQEEATPGILVHDIRPGLFDRVEPQAVLAAQQLAILMPDLKEIEYAPITGLRFQHPKGWTVYLGVGDDMAHRVNVLHAVEAQFAGDGKAQPSLVDLRFPDSPYYRLPSDEQGGG